MMKSVWWMRRANAPIATPLVCDAEPQPAHERLASLRLTICEEGGTNVAATVELTKDTFVVSNYTQGYDRAVFVSFKRLTNTAHVSRYISFILDETKSYTFSSNFGGACKRVGKRSDVVFLLIELFDLCLHIERIDVKKTDGVVGE